MSYLGQAALKNSELKRFDVTSSTSATHTLSWQAPNEQSLIITINGVKQQDDSYTIAGDPTVITLSEALIAADKMEVIGILDIGVITVVGDNTITSGKLGANAVSTAKIQDDAVTLAKQAAGTQGGTFYYAASGAPTQLAAGTSGQFLKTQGAAANPVWGDVTTSPTGGGTDKIFYQNGQSVTTNYTVTASNNAMSAGPVTVANGIDVTLTGTSEWVIV